MALKKSEIYSTLIKCANKLRSNSGIGAESFKNYVLIILFLKYISDRVKSGERTMLSIPKGMVSFWLVMFVDMSLFRILSPVYAG